MSESVADRRAVVLSIVSGMQLLEAGDRLKPIDSLTLVELVSALEEKTGRDLLGMHLAAENFESIDSIEALLDRAKDT